MAAGSPAAPGTAFERPSARRLRYASFEMRVAAVAIDAVALFFVGGVLIIAGSVNLLLSSDFDRVNASGDAVGLFWALVAAVPAACFLYFFLGLGFWGRPPAPPSCASAWSAPTALPWASSAPSPA